MSHIVRVELSDETAARLGDLSTATGAPPAALVRAAVEAKYGRRPGPHFEMVVPARRPRPESDLFEYGGEG